jgi:phosphatidylserine/phosphatidylglycerophosphate/cardiolipin synthase-like enzyme
MSRSRVHILQSKLIGLWLMVFAVACGAEYIIYDPGSGGAGPGSWGKSDGVDPTRSFEVLFNEPFCDVCTGDDKAYLKANSAITSRVIELLDRANTTVDIAQFTFSVKEIEEAILRTHQRGVRVRMAMNATQSQGNTVSTRLRDAGVDVQFRSGRHVESGDYDGLQHAKFMVVDESTLLTGSNNWSSTGTSINEENTIVLQGLRSDPILEGFRCHFDVIWNDRIDQAASCSNGEASFTPGTPALKMIKDAIRSAESTVDVAMHHMLFSDLIKELAKSAERGIAVRVMINAQDRGEMSGTAWNRLLAAGAQIRFKQTNADLYQLMHHKLVIVDDTLLVNGSGNWSGSAFFNNYENYVRFTDPRVLEPFTAMYERLWVWSLTADSLDFGLSAAQQDAAQTHVFFGNLHAHYESHDDHGLMDDGQMIHVDDNGEQVSILGTHDGARYAYEYARDQGKMDFMALSPHCQDEKPEDTPSIPNMSHNGFDELMDVSAHVTSESWGAFVAIPAMEWSTNSTGNHVNIFGSSELSKIERGRFDQLYDDYLPRRRAEGDRPLLQFNHPRTFRRYSTDILTGNWDQIFEVDLSTIPKNSQRTKKFNDFGLDDYPPLSQVRDRWISGVDLPDRSIVAATLTNIEKSARPYARLMEVTVGRGKEIAHRNRQNPSLMDDGAGGVERFTRVHSDWDYYLMNGFRLAPTAPHDNHFANWGTGHSSRTAVIASSLSEATVLDAMDRRAVYASEDENLTIRFYADGRIPMGGQHTTLTGDVSLNIHLHDPDYYGAYEVRVYRGRVRSEDGLQERQQVAGVVADQWFTIPMSLSAPGEHVVYLEVFEVDANRMAWTAPIWINKL